MAEISHTRTEISVNFPWKSNQVKLKNNQKTSIPINDINSIIIDTPLVSLTSTFLSHCGENGVAVYICDKYHLPNSVLIPFAKHHRWLEVLYQQIAWKEPYKKRLWKEIVEQKILNQKIVLDKANKNSSYIKRFIGCKSIKGIIFPYKLKFF